MVERPKPSVPFLLIRPQYFFQVLRHLIVRIRNSLKALDQLFEMPVTIGIKPLLPLQHLVQVERPVCRKMHFPFGELFDGKVKILHHPNQLIQRLVVLQLQEIAVFQNNKAALLLVLVQYLQHLILRQFSGRNRQVQKIALQRDSDVELHASAKAKPAEPVCHSHLAKRQLCQFIQAMIQKIIRFIGIAIDIKNLQRLIIIGKISGKP